jgi:hypothetical protein
VTVRLDRRGIAEFLKSPEVKKAVHDEAVKVARKVEAMIPNVSSSVIDPDVVVDDYVTDRAASSVTVRHPQALIWQARNGLMTRAASAAGHKIVRKR